MSPKIRKGIARLFRYGATSLICLGISEATLLVIVATRLTGATVAAAIANVAGVVPSYLLSRYWIWSEADRSRTGRQVTLYWMVSIASIVITSLATGFVAHHSPSGGSLRVEIVGAAFLGINFVLWLAKYAAYQSFVFRSSSGAPAVAGGADTAGPAAFPATTTAFSTVAAAADLPAGEPAGGLRTTVLD